jgi:uncharacterized protein DUF4328
MDCPRCGLVTPDTAVWCDCGHNFTTGRLRGDPAAGGPATRIGPFNSATSRARWTVGLLVGGICLDVVAIMSGLLEISLVNRALSGEAITASEAASSDSRQQLIGILQIGLYIAAAVTFLMWISRSYRNLSALSSSPCTYSPGWAIGAFFVPFLNLVRPFQIVRELWHLSDSSSTVTTVRTEGQKPPTPPIVGWWWGVWLVAGFLGQAVWRFSWRATTLQEILTAGYITIAADAVGIAAAVLAISLVRSIDARQAVSYRRLKTGSEAGGV